MFDNLVSHSGIYIYLFIISFVLFIDYYYDDDDNYYNKEENEYKDIVVCDEDYDEDDDDGDDEDDDDDEDNEYDNNEDEGYNDCFSLGRFILYIYWYILISFIIIPNIMLILLCLE
jgi:hypothetical protein